MIKFSNGHKFEYMAASGALGDGRGWPWERLLCRIGLINPSLFTVVIKTLTRHPRKGNPRWYLCIRPLKGGGFVNALGLPNIGVKRWCDEIAPSIDFSSISLVGSIFSNNIDELQETAIMLNRFDFKALEINPSCPNTGEELQNTEFVIKSCKAANKVSHFPIILKMSVVHDIETIIPEVKKNIEAISINSVPWKIVFPDRPSPFASLGGGGVSGKVAQKHTWGLVEKLAKKTSMPVICPSVWNYEDIAELRKRGAVAISFGSIFLGHPCRPTQFARRDVEEQRNL